jgi:hypothetical protein
MLKVTFDSNIWRIVVSPEKFPKNPCLSAVSIIRDAISKKQIYPFLSETIFTLEGIQRKNRKDFLTNYTPKTSISTQEVESGIIKISFTIGPDISAHPRNNCYLDSHLKDAIAIGFRLLKAPRIAGIINPDIEHFFYNPSNLEDYHSRLSKIGRDIETRGCGIAQIKEIGKKYAPHWLDGLKIAPDGEKETIANAMAEWADGDSVAAHYALDGDIFCTLDSAKKAGERSVFDTINSDWIKSKYGVNILSPNELSKFIEKQPQGRGGERGRGE